MKYLIAIIITQFSLLSICYAEIKQIMHNDKELAYSISYPSNWMKTIKPVQSGKLTRFNSKSTPKLICQLVTSNLSYKNPRSYINDYVRKNPFTKKSWYDRFKPTAEFLKVIENKQVMISGFLAEQAVLETTNSIPKYGKLYGKYLTHFINTPGITWNVICSVVGLQKKEVVHTYRLNENKFKKIINSIKFSAAEQK